MRARSWPSFSDAQIGQQIAQEIDRPYPALETETPSSLSGRLAATG
jgi:hypothetical protein